MDLFSPSIHLQESKDGKAVGEFPVLYYLAALIWKITGPSMFVIRAIHLLIAFCGLFALFKLSNELLKDLFFALLIPVVIYASPVFGFYSNSFLVNIDALSLLFIGWYFLYRYHSNKKFMDLVLAVAIVSLAGLLRTTMLIGYIPVALMFFAEFMKQLNRESIPSLLKSTLIGVPFLFVVGWMLYISGYNASSGSVYFLTTIRPIWDTPEPGKIWEALLTRQLSEVYPMTLLVIFVLLIIVSLITWRKHENLLVAFVLFLTVELIAYILLWFANLDVHDYYLIELLILVPPLMILLVQYIKKYQRVYRSIYFRAALSIVVLVVVLFGAVKTRIKYDPKLYFLTEVMLSQEEIEYYKWYHWDYGMKLQAFETVEPYLNSIGIDRSKKVVSIPDPSSNISLSLMDRKGYTLLYVQPDQINSSVTDFKKKGAEYLMVYDSTFLENKELDTFMYQPIGRYRNIHVFKL
jgi:general stress protein CsbA